MLTFGALKAKQYLQKTMQTGDTQFICQENGQCYWEFALRFLWRWIVCSVGRTEDFIDIYV